MPEMEIEMEPTTLGPTGRDLITQMTSSFRSAHKTLGDLTTRLLLGFILRSLITRLKHWPSPGEIVTEIARFEAGVTRFDHAVREAAIVAYAKERVTFLRTFWGDRQARIPADLKPEFEAFMAVDVADLRESLKGFFSQGVDHKLRTALLMRDEAVPDVEACKALWREAEAADSPRDDNPGAFEVIIRTVWAKAVREVLVRATDLPAPVRTDLEEALSQSAHAYTAAIRTVGLWTDARKPLLKLSELGLGRGNFHFLPGWEKNIGGMDTDRYDHLVKHLVKTPEADVCLRTVLEKEIGRARQNVAAWRAGEPVEGTLEIDNRQALFVLQHGMVGSLADANASLLLLELFDELGIALDKPADKVTVRHGPAMAPGGPATWYAYSTDRGHTALFALYPRDRAFDTVFLVRGSLEEALVWLAEHYSPPTWQDNRLELLDAPAGTPNGVVDALNAQDGITAARALQAEVAQYLADYIEDQQQDY